LSNKIEYQDLDREELSDVDEVTGMLYDGLESPILFYSFYLSVHHI